MWSDEPKRQLIEPLFQAESHRYQTLQAADWIAGLVGRLGACWAERTAYSDNQVFCCYFEHRLDEVARRSGVRDAARTPLQNHLPLLQRTATLDSKSDQVEHSRGAGGAGGGGRGG
ncbi:MAG: DUF3800 domain-containing protein, partial [Synechococcus sp. SB0675_bin_6]|nr:DUF3800 domain-containing protein [Synechococcus sp. SB0675_bin_6]